VLPASHQRALRWYHGAFRQAANPFIQESIMQLRIAAHQKPKRSPAAKLRAISLLSLLAFLFIAFFSLAAPTPRRVKAATNANGAVSAKITPPNAQTRPRLVLLIVVDQFRYDYLERFDDLFNGNGLGRLLREGASWTQADYDHMPTYTAPGHATMLTGTWPANNGIVANDWYDRETGKNVTSVSDATAKLLGGLDNEAASSPRRLMASTIGDELRLATNDRSKVIGISIKDRAAILPAGRHASAAYWFSAQSGHMVSSNYYFNQLPAWVTTFNDTHPADKYFGARWERILPEAEYLKRAGQDAPSWENIGKVAGDTNSFPHIVTGGASVPGKDFYNALDATPFSNDLLLSFAEQAIASENLGADDDTDVLTLSFSANDYVGHRYGPYSQEVMDITLRTDRQIGALLDFVNARIGLQNTLVVFTADHGVAPIPEHAAALNLPGGRISNAEVLRAIRAAIAAKYARSDEAKDRTADYVSSFINGNVYFNTVALKRDGINEVEIERVAGEAAMTVPGITHYFTRADLQTSNISSSDSLARRVQHGFYTRRSGDVIVVYEPFKYLVDSPITATHGSPYSYDTHVPLIMLGEGLVPASYAQAATPADIAPTIAAILRIQQPSNATGRVLLEALAPAKARAQTNRR
jgi:predicted AlkP superfamily pyrophosphatase or phosphodiesterase